MRALGAGSVTDTAAWLGGEVNPRNSPTSAYVEYTLKSDIDYADAVGVPVSPDGVDMGEGNEYVTVTQLATGLQPGTEYRFRVVATSPAGTTVGADRVFTTRKAAPKRRRGAGTRWSPHRTRTAATSTATSRRDGRNVGGRSVG